jgi:hypothetical protein
MRPTPLDVPATRCALRPGILTSHPDLMQKTEQTCADHSGDWRVSGMRLRLILAAAFLIISQSLCAGGALAAQATSANTSAASQQAPAAKHRKKPAASHTNVATTQPAAQPAPAPPPPPPPNWPANDQPVDAKVTWDSKGLGIVAANSSLSQILKDVSSQTGATLQGFNHDERVFGIYGPGPARDVINQLLDGSGYNVLLIGDQGEGTPRQILLTPRTGGVSPPSRTNNQNPPPEEDTIAEQEQRQPEPPPPVQAQPAQNGAPGVPVRTQQEIMEQMQERQRQLQQQQQPTAPQ